jgi:NodT family efflux transporter outer membrane factor (OMF) lipoprotein
MMNLLRLSTCVAVVALVGCAAGPDYRAPSVDTGDGWAEPSAASEPLADMSQWWTTFDDPTLDRLVERARSNNRSLRQAVARVTEARALLDASAGGRYPNVDLRASVTERRQSENGPLPIGQIPGLERDQTIYETGFDASWEFDLFGRTRRSIEAAEARFGETMEQSHVAQLTVTAEVARMYLSLRGLQRERAAQESAVQLSRQTAALVHRQFELGEVAEAEVTQTNAELASLEAQLPLLDAEIRSMALALGVLLGELPEAELALIRERTDYPALSRLPVGERADLLRRRPDVRAAEWRLAAATADVGVTTAELFPRLSISAAGSFQALDASELFESGSETWSLVPLVSWRIFDGGRIRAHIRASEAGAEAAALAYEDAVLAALLEAERALSRYHYGLIAVEQQGIAVAAARRSHELGRIRYRAGDIALLELVDAERTLRNAEIAYARTHRAVEMDLVALFKALGGGWQ